MLSDQISLTLEGKPIVRLSVEGETLWEAAPVYQELEYIYLDGNTYVDTGFIPAEHDDGILSYFIRVDLDNIHAGKPIYLFGVTDGTLHNCSALFAYAANSEYNTLSVKAGEATAGRYFPTMPDQPMGLSASVKATSVNWKTDVTGYTGDRSAVLSDSISVNDTVYVGDCHGATDGVGLVGKVYEFVIATYAYPVTVPLSEEGRLLHLVPCMRTNDGAVGMYDRLSDVFFPMMGTGEATPGPAL